MPTHEGVQGYFVATRVIYINQNYATYTEHIYRLPLDSVMLVISEVLPKVQELQFSRDKANPTGAIMDLLRSISLEHVLPSTPPMTPRKFIVSVYPKIIINVHETAIISICSRSLAASVAPEQTAHYASNCLCDLPLLDLRVLHVKQSNVGVVPQT